MWDSRVVSLALAFYVSIYILVTYYITVVYPDWMIYLAYSIGATLIRGEVPWDIVFLLHSLFFSLLTVAFLITFLQSSIPQPQPFRYTSTTTVSANPPPFSSSMIVYEQVTFIIIICTELVTCIWNIATFISSTLPNRHTTIRVPYNPLPVPIKLCCGFVIFLTILYIIIRLVTWGFAIPVLAFTEFPYFTSIILAFLGFTPSYHSFVVLSYPLFLFFFVLEFIGFADLVYYITSSSPGLVFANSESYTNNVVAGNPFGPFQITYTNMNVNAFGVLNAFLHALSCLFIIGSVLITVAMGYYVLNVLEREEEECYHCHRRECCCCDN
jgi:hypothetical protein